MDPKIADNYEDLVVQFKALLNLFNMQERRLVALTRHDYALSEAKLKALEEALESEKEMNAILTRELDENKVFERCEKPQDDSLEG